MRWPAAWNWLANRWVVDFERENCMILAAMATAHVGMHCAKCKGRDSEKGIGIRVHVSCYACCTIYPSIKQKGSRTASSIQVTDTVAHKTPHIEARRLVAQGAQVKKKH